MEFKTWTDYFEERLAYTIRKKEFLRTLQERELKALLEEVFRAIYKVDDFGPDSFLDFFTTRMQGYIGGSFRENIARMITVHPSIDDRCSVEEHLEYKCRKIDSPSSTIQAIIKFTADEFDMSKLNYKITLRPPRETQNFELRSKFPPRQEDGSYIFRKMDLNRLEGYVKDLSVPEKRHGFELSLKEFKDIDDLHVQVDFEYSIPTDRFFAWVMNYPSKEFETHINYPDEEFEILVETFGMNDDEVTITKQTGAYKLKYDSWLLPESGLAYRFIKRKDASPKPKAASVAVENILESNGNGFPEEELRLHSPPSRPVTADATTDNFENDSILKGVDPSETVTEAVPGESRGSDESGINGSVRTGDGASRMTVEVVAEKRTADGEFDEIIIRETYHQFSGMKTDE